ncbi:protein kinase [bacterium]|nr:protein kinase [candidate division CSSED10-310 bacterium]
MLQQTDRQIQDLLDQCEDMGLFARGGMSTLKLLTHRDSGQRYVVKIMNQSFGDNRHNIDRFYHEIKIYKRLQHDNIINITHYGKVEGQYCLVMEYADNGCLRDLINSVGWLAVHVSLFIIMEILKGLQYSHENNIIHRDIKPSNVLLTSGGGVMLSDFGISRVEDLTRLTQEGSILGTPAYMSPEQATGAEVQHASDIFSTGLVFYEMLTGINPFISDNPGITLMNIINTPHHPIFEINPTIPSALDSIIEEMLNKNIRQRYQNCAEVLQDLEQFKTANDIRFSRLDFRDYLQNPGDQETSLRHETAASLFDNAKELYGDGQGRADLAAVELYKSLHLNPENQPAKDMFDGICTRNGFQFKREASDKIKKLVEALQEKPDNIAILLRLVKLNQIEGNLLKAIAYSKRLKRLRPKDNYILSQLQTLLPDGDQDEFTGSVQNQFQTMAMTPEQRPQSPRNEARSKEFYRSDEGVTLGSIFNARNFILVTLLLIGILSIFIMVRAVVDMGQDITLESVPPISSQQGQSADRGPVATIELGRELFQNAVLAFQKNDVNKALKLFEMYLDSFSGSSRTPEVYYNLVQIHEQLGNSLKVEDVSNILLLQHPTSPFTIKLLVERGERQLAGNKLDRSIWEFEKAYTAAQQLDGSPLDKDIDSRLFLGYSEALAKDDQHDRAVYVIDDFLQRRSMGEEANKARVMKADILLTDGDRSAALELYKIVRDNTAPGSELFKSVVEKIALLD